MSVRLSALLVALLALSLSGCATTPPAPMPFSLIDRNSVVHSGVIRPADRSMEVSLGSKVYRGFYVTSSSTARSTNVGVGIGYGSSYGYYGAYGYPAERWAVISNNDGRAHLSTPDGEHLSCEFMFENRRAIGECKSPDGVRYQMVADQPRP